MRLSKYFFRTLKDAPHDADIPSHQLLERGGYVQRLARGHYIYSPLMQRVFNKLCRIIREEMEKAGAIELTLPLVHPASIWQASGRWEDYKAENLLFIIQDREDNLACLAPTHEEAIVTLVASWVNSYKQIPLNLYQIGTKFRDEIRPRFGLIRSKEFLMKDGYSFAADAAGMEKQYTLMRDA
ncbi:MAG: aminoacyl--tRNA ligase-related protein, partial [Chlamydiales bacterium]